jgi:hypothetical protein
MTFTTASSKDRIKIKYHHEGHHWFAEQTKKNYERGISWFQWGETKEFLGMSVELTEQLVFQWLVNYNLLEED